MLSHSHKTYTGTVDRAYNICVEAVEAVLFLMLVGTGIFILSISDAIDLYLGAGV